MPYSLTCSPRLTASVRRASLCLPEPVKCWSRLPKVSSGTMRRSTGMPAWVTARAPASPDECTTSISASPPNASTSACGSAVAATTSRSLHVSAIRRALPASSTLVASGLEAGHDRLADRERLGEQEARRAFAGVVRGERGQHVLLRLLAEARHVVEAAGLRRLAQVVERGRRRGARAAARTRFGPRPGMRVTSTSPAGIRACSLSADGIVPPSSSASIFSAIVLPTPASSSTRPALRQVRDGHARLADRLGRVAVGHHAVDHRAVELVEAGQLVEGVGDLGVSHGAGTPG